MQPDQCSETMVKITDLCALGGEFNWSRYFLNDLIDDTTQAQHKPNYKFHYSWLLILIAFTLWANPPDYVHMDVPLPCHGARYQNPWMDKEDPIKQKENNIEFFLHTKALCDYLSIPLNSRCDNTQVRNIYQIYIRSTQNHFGADERCG